MQKFGLAFLAFCLVAVFYHAYSGLGSSQAKHDELRLKLANVLQEVDWLKKANEKQLSQIKGESGTIKRSEEALEEKLSNVKEEVLETKSEVDAEESMLKQMQQKLKELESKVEACKCQGGAAAPAATGSGAMSDEVSVQHGNACVM